MRKRFSLMLRTSRGPRCGFALLVALAILVVTGPALAGNPTTTITFPWDWHISVAPNVGGPTGMIPGEIPVDIWLWGGGTIRFGEPLKIGGDPSAPTTFDLGPGGGLGAPIPAPVPLGGIYQIPIEIVELHLSTMGMQADFPAGPSNVEIQLLQPGQGLLNNVQNNGDGTVSLDSFFDIVYRIDLPELGMQLQTTEPTQLGMSFGPPGTPNPIGGMVMPPLPDVDILWAPTWIWRTFPPGQAPPWVDSSFHPWDWPVTIHGHVTVPEPMSVGLLVLAMALIGTTGARRRSRS